jgi:hypothetical protein
MDWDYARRQGTMKQLSFLKTPAANSTEYKAAPGWQLDADDTLAIWAI